MSNLLPREGEEPILSPSAQTVLSAYATASPEVLVDAFTMFANDAQERGLDLKQPGVPKTWLKLPTFGSPIPTAVVEPLRQELPELVQVAMRLGFSELLLSVLDSELTYAELITEEDEP